MKNIEMIAAITAVTLFAGAVSAQQVGVVGLYQNGSALNVAAISDLGCTIQRSGVIVAMQGKLSTPMTQPDQFVVLSCEAPIMADSERRATIAPLSNGGGTIALFEGAMTDFEELANARDASGRQYILKLGYYNNADIDARNANLMALDAKASDREGVWTTESFLQVQSASGVATPDEVVILYYDSAEIAENFRDENQDILEDVTAFNSAHLNGFSYLIGMVCCTK